MNQHPPRNARDIMVLICLSTLAFFPLAAFFSPLELVELLAGLVSAVAFGVSVAYLPAALQASREGVRTPGQVAIIATLLAQLGIGLRQLYAYVYRILGMSPEWRETYLLAIILWISFVAGCLNFIAARAIDGKVPREDWLRLGVWVAIGLGCGILGVSLVVTSPA